MEDWKYTFEPVSKALWLKQIEADLHSKGLDSLQSEWWPGEPIIPFHQHEDRKDDIILPNSLFDQPPKIIEWIDTTMLEARVINNRILNALNYGAESLILQIDTNDKMPFRLWLHDVLTDMIELSVCADQEAPEIIHAIKEIIPRSSLIRLQRKNHPQSSSVFFEALQGSLDETANTFRFVYSIPGSGSWINQTVKIFQLLLDDLAYWTSQGLNPTDFLESCILSYTPDEKYYKQVIQMRVLHLLWNNLWSHSIKGNHLSSSPYLECHIVNHTSVEPDQYLIQSSSSALGASLTGAHGFCVHHQASEDIPIFYQRIDRNIHHLLHMESEMYRGVDPLAGSYTFDFYTRKWTEEIWEKLKRL